jgi:hypothetical protein
MVACAAALWAVVLVSQSVPPSQVPPPPASGLIVGRVVDGSSGRPVSGAIVTLEGGAAATGAGRAMPRALTSGTGQFVFRKVAKGSYQLRGSRAGYADGSYGQRRPGGVSAALQLDDAQRVGDVVIPIWKHATISGAVVDEAGEPLIGVQVRAFSRRFVAGRPRMMFGPIVTTDDRGTYRFASLVPGDYLVAFVSSETAVPTGIAEMLMNAAFTNDPKNGDLMRQRMVLGGAMMQPGSPSAVQVGPLLRNLSFGGPVPPIAADENAVFVYPTQFYPGVPSAARARVLTLASGEARESIDFALRPVKTARVSGAVTGPEGPAANLAVRLVQAGEDAEIETAVTMTGSAGEFTLLGVPPGQYVIKALRAPQPNTLQNQSAVTTQIQMGSSTIMTSSSGNPNAPPPPIPDDPTLVAEMPLSVGDTDLNDVIVPLQRAARLTGRFEFDGNAPRPDATATMRILVLMQRADGMPQAGPFLASPTGHADDTGAFKTYGLAPGKYLLRATAPDGWTLRSATANGRDLTDVPFDIRTADINDVVITYTDRPSKVSGMVHAGNGSPDPSALVVIFPADNSAWADNGVSPRRIRGTRPDRSGRYTFAALPPGDYYVAAIREETTPQWQDPQMLEEISRSAAQVHVGEGETRTQDLKSSGGGQ